VTLNENKKTESDEAETTCCGRLFHTRTAATGKAQSPYITSLVRRTDSSCDEAERWENVFCWPW